jgi:hypothetical protein
MNHPTTRTIRSEDEDDIVTMNSRENQSGGMFAGGQQQQRVSNLGGMMMSSSSPAFNNNNRAVDPPPLLRPQQQQQQYNNNSGFNDASTDTAVMGSRLANDQSFLPSSGISTPEQSFLGSSSVDFEVDDDPLSGGGRSMMALPDQAQNSVLRMPVIPAEEIDVSTASMIEIRQASPQKRSDNEDKTTKKGTKQPQQRSQPYGTPGGRRAWLWSTVENEEDFIRLVGEFRRQGFPLGLATEICTDKMEAPFRVWLIDNNESLTKFADQHVLRYRAEDASVQLAKCTRWAELVETLESHALLADLMKVTGNFWFIRYVC